MTTPTHVFGYDARAYALAHGWHDAVIADSLNPKTGAGGLTEADRRDIFVTPGTYNDIPGFLGKRKFVTVRGDVANRPKMVKVEFGLQQGRELNMSGLELVDSPAGLSSLATDGPIWQVFEDIYQHTWTRELNGIGSPSDPVTTHPMTTVLRRFVSDGVGGKGNTRHGCYIHGRPNGALVIEDSEFRGARACSAIKTDCWRVEIRNTVLDTRSLLSDWTAHTLLDIAGCCSFVGTGLTVRLWNGPKALGDGKWGLQTAGLFFRRRREWLGSDRPAYPAVWTDGAWQPHWSPPKSGIQTAASPGGSWSKGPETFVDDDFWAEVGAVDRLQQGPAPYMFEHYLSDITVESESFDGSQITFCRDDGTMPATPVTQFGRTRLLPNHPDYTERSRTLYCGINASGPVRLFDLANSDSIAEIDPGAIWPRTEPHHFPVAVEVPIQCTPPAWFET